MQLKPTEYITHTHISFSFMVEGYHCIELPYPKIYEFENERVELI